MFKLLIYILSKSEGVLLWTTLIRVILTIFTKNSNLKKEIQNKRTKKDYYLATIEMTVVELKSEFDSNNEVKKSCKEKSVFFKIKTIYIKSFENIDKCIDKYLQWKNYLSKFKGDSLYLKYGIILTIIGFFFAIPLFFDIFKIAFNIINLDFNQCLLYFGSDNFTYTSIDIDFFFSYIEIVKSLVLTIIYWIKLFFVLLKVFGLIVFLYGIFFIYIFISIQIKRKE